MAGSTLRMMRPVAGAIGAIPFVGMVRSRCSQCDETPKFESVKCLKNERHTGNTRLITLSSPGSFSPKSPIVNVLVKADVKGEAEPVVRPYNPISIGSQSEVTLLVKRYADARMGTKLHDLKVGESIEVKGPNRQWAFEQGVHSHYCMVAGGTGVTPLVQAAEHILKNDSAEVTFLTFNKSSEDVLLRRQLAHMEVKYPGRFRVTHVVEGNASLTDLEGSPTAATLEALLPKPSCGVFVMVCGRGEMTAAVAGPKAKDYTQGELSGVLKTLGFTSSNVLKV